MTLPTVAAPTHRESGRGRSSGEDRPVTLVVPVRDEATTLPSLLRSIERQTRAPEHVVFVDAGSLDASRHLLAEACGRHPGWRLTCAGPATPGRARNVGIESAPSDTVALTDAGIELDPHWLERLVRQASPEVDIVWGHVEPAVTTPFTAAASLVLLAPTEDTPRGPTRREHVSSCLIRRDLWRRAGGFPDLRASEDRLFIERIYGLGPAVALAPEATVTWQLVDGYRAAFAKYRLYSRVNVDAAQQHDWHHGVARMYLAALPFWIVAVRRSRWWAAVPLTGFAGRVVHNVWRRRAGRGVLWAADPARLARVGAITLTVDAATFAGWFDALVDRRMRS